MYSTVGRKLSLNKILFSGVSYEFHPDTIREIFEFQKGVGSNQEFLELPSLLSKLIEGRDGCAAQPNAVTNIFTILTGGGNIHLPFDIQYVEKLIDAIAERNNYGFPVPKGGDLLMWHVKDTSLLGPRIKLLVEKKRAWLSQLASIFD